jgi:hypothetical protein
LEKNGYDYQNASSTCVRWHRRLNSLLLQDGAAQRISMLDLDSDLGDTVRTAQQIAVSQDRIFYQRFRYADDGWQLVDPELVALAFRADGTLSRVGRITPEVHEPYASLVARGSRAFLSSSGKLEVFDGDDDLQSRTHELRSWGCTGSGLEVTDDRAFCALGMYGVQSIPLDGP